MIEILLNDVSPEGMRRIKAVSDAPILHQPPFFIEGPDRQFREWKDDALGLHYLEATWPCRETIEIKGEGWPCARIFTLFKLMPGERVSQAFQAAFGIWAETFKTFPDFAFMRRLPKAIENGYEMNGVHFFEADWVPPGCIAIGNGG